MLFLSLATVSILGVLTGSLAIPLASTSATQVNTFDLSASRVNTALKELSAEMETMFTTQSAGWATVAQRITARVNDVVSVSKYGSESMRAAEVLGYNEAIALWGPVRELSALSDDVNKKFVRMKPIVFQMNNGQRAVLGLLESLEDVSNEFTLAMSSKMPTGANWVGVYYGNSVATMVANTIKEYQNPPKLSSAPGTWF